MADKGKKRVRALQEKTGWGYQMILNQVRAGRTDEEIVAMAKKSPFTLTKNINGDG